MKNKKIKILISAYSCDPLKGSEAGGGWGWIENLSEYNLITVITRGKNKENIENNLVKLRNKENVNFMYFDLPYFIRIFKKGEFGTNWYYYIWEIVLAFKLKRNNSFKDFDIAHHLTYGAIWRPSCFMFANIPFIFGPVGGAELIPKRYWKILGKKEALFEIFRRYILKFVFKWDPFLKKTFKNAKLILVTSNDSLENLPKSIIKKTKIFPQFGINVNNNKIKKNKDNGKLLNILFAGRPYNRKGFILSIKAIEKYLLESNNINFTILIPPEYYKLALRNINKLKTKNYKIISKFLNREEILKIYKDNDIFLYPSFRDAWGMVILEAMSQGLPPIVLNFGGPSEIVNNDYGSLINLNEEENIINDIVNNINLYASNSGLLLEKSKKAIDVVETKYSWNILIKKMQELYYIVLNENTPNS